MLLMITVFSFSTSIWAKQMPHPTTTPSPQTVEILKKTMSQFGSMVAGLQILMVKEKKPDFEAIEITLQEMKEALAKLQKADVNQDYKPFTDQLALSLEKVTEQNKKKDKKIYKGIDKMTDTCFRCHAVHRDQNFLTQ
jgi:molecular chaperone GrpE (heat shock protein)